MSNNRRGKTLGLGIIFIIMGGLFVPCSQCSLNQIQQNPLSINEQTDLSTDDVTITCYIGGVPHTQKISYESGTHLEGLFAELAIANANDSNSFETQQLQRQILLYAEQQGLLPAAVSAEKILTQLGKIRQGLVNKQSQRPLPLDAGTSHQFFCNFVSTGEGSAFPIIILPRFIPIIMAPIPRLFVGWKTPLGITSCGGLMSGKGFIASGQQQGLALGFWGIGFSIFLPPVMAYGMFGYALYTKVTAAEMRYWPPNNPPKITATFPLDGATYVPLAITELSFHISDLDGDLMGYSVTTSPDIGGGNGNLKPDGTYTIPVSGLQDLTTYTWHIKVTDGKDTTEQTATFTTEAVTPIISNPLPEDTERDVPMNLPQLQFTLKDYQGDTMEYTVQTSPVIGSDHKTGVRDGTFTVPISGMTYGSMYHWYVNVTDGMHWTRKVFRFSTGYPSPFNPFDYGWQYRKPITINHSLVTDDLEGFPVLISITDVDLMKAQVDGDDLLFMNSTGSTIKLRHEIEEFNQGAGGLIAWVKIPSVSAEEDTVFYLYYGNPGCINQEYPEKTWDSNYVAVWHMNDATSKTISDSTINSISGTKKDIHAPTEWSGKTGKGQLYNRSSTVWEYITMGDSDLLEFSGDFTVSAWIKPFTTENMKIAGKNQEISANYKGYALNWNLQGTGTKMSLRVDGGGYNYQYIFANADEPPNNWYYIVGTKQSGVNYLYINGTRQIQTGSQSLINSEYPFCIGGWKTDAANANFHGIIDEVRVSKIGRSSSWIQTGYHNQNSPSTFLTVGFEEPGP